MSTFDRASNGSVATGSGRCPMRLRRRGALILAAAVVLEIGLALPLVARAGPTFEETVRFLEQATFGPTPDLIAHVQDVGFDAFLAEQFARSAPVFPQLDNWPQNPPSTCTGNCLRDNYSMYPLQVGAFSAFLTSPDQLRLRVAFA